MGNVYRRDCYCYYYAFAAEPINKFVNRHPAFKMLALSFLLLIGVSLIAEGFEVKYPRGIFTSPWPSH